MHPHGVELSDIHADERGALLGAQVVAGRKSLGLLEIGVAAGRLAVDVPDQLLQGVEAHPASFSDCSRYLDGAGGRPQGAALVSGFDPSITDGAVSRMFPMRLASFQVNGRSSYGAVVMAADNVSLI